MFNMRKRNCKDFVRTIQNNLSMKENMKNKEYTKINLRDFRHNLTQLKDSIEAGMIYEVYDRGIPTFICASKNYEIIPKLQKQKTADDFEKMLSMPTDKVDLPKNLDVDKEYGKLLDEKYKR